MGPGPSFSPLRQVRRTCGRFQRYTALPPESVGPASAAALEVERLAHAHDGQRLRLTQSSFEHAAAGRTECPLCGPAPSSPPGARQTRMAASEHACRLRFLEHGPEGPPRGGRAGARCLTSFRGRPGGPWPSGGGASWRMLLSRGWVVGPRCGGLAGLSCRGREALSTMLRRSSSPAAEEWSVRI